MKCDICDYYTAGITSLTHHKKIHYTPEKTFECTKCGKGFRNKFHLPKHYQTPSKNKVKVFQCFISGKCFQEKLKLREHNGNIHQSIRRCTMSFHIEIKHPDPNMPFPEWSCEISKEPYPQSRAPKGHIKWVHKPKPIYFFNVK